MKTSATIVRYAHLARIALATASLAIFAGGALAARAAEASASTAPAPRSAAAQERMQEMARELNLTDAQKEQLKPILKAQMEKLAALREDKNLSRVEKMKRLKAIRDENLPEIKGILTPEQFEKWQKKQAEGREHLRENIRERVREKRGQ